MGGGWEVGERETSRNWNDQPDKGTGGTNSAHTVCVCVPVKANISIRINSGKFMANFGHLKQQQSAAASAGPGTNWPLMATTAA